MTAKTRTLWLVTLAVLLAAALRWPIIPAMRRLMTPDEAYYILDAASLIDAPRLTPFFPGNDGRESGFMYLLAPFILGLGDWLFAGRITAAFIGVLAVAMTYRLSADLFGRRAGLFAALGLATLYWHVHLSHLVFRAMLMPLFGALAFLLLWRALKWGGLRRWTIAGAGFGALAYSYISARAWMALLALIILGAMWKRPAIRKGAFVGMAVGLIAVAPLLFYMLQNLDASVGRMRNVGIFSPSAIASNIGAWLGAPLFRGDQNPILNLPGRPIFDLAQAAMALAGCIVLAREGRLRARGLLVASMAITALAPSLLSDFAPHSLRAVGATVPIAILIGVGANAVFGFVRATVTRAGATARGARLAAAGLLVVAAGSSAVITARDLYGKWLPDPLGRNAMWEGFSTALDVLQSRKAGGAAVFFGPEVPESLARFGGRKLDARASLIEPSPCLTVEASPSWLILSMALDDEESVLQPLRKVAEIERVGVYPDANSNNAIGLFGITPRPVAWDREWVFGNRLGAVALEWPASAEPGGQIDVLLQIRARAPMNQPYSAFVHVYPSTTSTNGPKTTQGDSWLCPTHPTTAWRTDQIFFQHFNATLPKSTPPGEYEIHLGFYEAPNGAPLVLTDGASPARDSVILGRFVVR